MVPGSTWEWPWDFEHRIIRIVTQDNLRKYYVWAVLLLIGSFGAAQAAEPTGDRESMP